MKAGVTLVVVLMVCGFLMLLQALWDALRK